MKYIINIITNTNNAFSFLVLKNKFDVFENYLLKQNTISTMLILILITFAVSLLINIS